MNCTAWNEIRFTWPDRHCSSIHGKGEYAFNSVNGFIVMFVRMRQRNLGSNRNHKLKHGYGTVRVGSFKQELNSYLPDADDFVLHSLHSTMQMQ